MGCKKKTPPNSHHNAVNKLFTSDFDPEKVSGELEPFPVLNNPNYINAGEVDFLDSSSLVLCFRTHKNVYVYPISQLYIEVVNDVVEGEPIAITYCPLTMSGICWKRVLNNDTLLLTASGYLYCDNQMTLDTISGSIWSQMLLKCGKGNYFHQEIETVPLIETLWYNIQLSYPDANVFKLDMENGLRYRNFGAKINSSSNRVFGILGPKAPILIDDLLFKDSVKIVNSRGYMAIGNKDRGFLNVFNSKYTMRPIQNLFPVVMQDQSGSQWDIFGYAVSGPKKGEMLIRPKSYVALDWAWRNLFGNVEKY